MREEIIRKLRYFRSQQTFNANKFVNTNKQEYRLSALKAAAKVEILEELLALDPHPNS